MSRIRTAAVAFASTIALGSGVALTAPAANAGPPDNAANPAPCAQQQAQLNRATAKLADLTVKFANHPTKKNKRAEKAQVKRVAHATARLDKCTAAQPASAAAATDMPCSHQQAQLERATAKLDKLATHFAAHPTKKNKRAEKAQVKRVEHATARLDKCTAAQAG